MFRFSNVKVYSAPISVGSEPISIEVFGDVGLVEVVKWLRRALTFEVNYACYGAGPIADSCVLIGLHWTKIQERKDLK